MAHYRLDIIGMHGTACRHDTLLLLPGIPISFSVTFGLNIITDMSLPINASIFLSNVPLQSSGGNSEHTLTTINLLTEQCIRQHCVCIT